MPDEDDIRSQQNLLLTHRKMLAFLLEQAAKEGSPTLAFIKFMVAEKREAIQGIKAYLRSMGVEVEDQRNDSDPSTDPASVRLNINTIRPPVRDFKDRQDYLNDLCAFLRSQNSTERPIAYISGMGGIGKTELALKVVETIQESFKDGAIRINLRGSSKDPLSPDQVLQTCIHKFRPEAPLLTASEPEDAYQELFATRHMLIFVDDVADDEQIERLVECSGTCAILITSRWTLGLLSSGVWNKTLEPLPLGDAMELLTGVCPRIGNAAEDLAKVCGCHPQALRLAAGTLNGSIQVKNYIRWLTRLDSPSSNELWSKLEKVFQTTYSVLDSAARETLIQLTIFPASFNREAAYAVVQSPYRQALTRRAGQPEAAEQDDHQDYVEMHLNTLCRFCLVQWHEQPDRFEIHQVIRSFVLRQSDAPMATHLRHAIHYANVARQASIQYQSGGKAIFEGLALFDRERANIDAGRGWARERMEAHYAGALILEYMDATAIIGHIRYTPEERQSQLKDAQGAAERLQMLPEMGRLLINLGSASAQQGDLAHAAAHYEQALSYVRAAGDAKAEHTALGNLGNVLLEQGHIDAAIDNYNMELHIATECKDNTGIIKAHRDLGDAYIQQGDFDRAYAAFTASLSLARQIDDVENEALACWYLGDLCNQQGQLAEAVTYIQVFVDYRNETKHHDAVYYQRILQELKQQFDG